MWSPGQDRRDAAHDEVGGRAIVRTMAQHEHGALLQGGQVGEGEGNENDVSPFKGHSIPRLPHSPTSPAQPPPTRELSPRTRAEGPQRHGPPGPSGASRRRRGRGARIPSEAASPGASRRGSRSGPSRKPSPSLPSRRGVRKLLPIKVSAASNRGPFDEDCDRDVATAAPSRFGQGTDPGMDDILIPHRYFAGRGLKWTSRGSRG